MLAQTVLVQYTPKILDVYGRRKNRLTSPLCDRLFKIQNEPTHQHRNHEISLYEYMIIWNL